MSVVSEYEAWTVVYYKLGLLKLSSYLVVVTAILQKVILFTNNLTRLLHNGRAFGHEILS